MSLRSSRPDGASRARVLVIEDDAEAGALLHDLLQWHGYTVRTAPDGAEGLAAATAFDPHFVLLDVQLPGVHGIEVARHLRVAEDGHQRVIIGTTCLGLPQEGLPPAFDHWVSKPIDVERLCSLMHREWQGRFSDHPPN